MVARVFAPASVTCIFSPQISSSVEESGSVGVGFTVNKGVYAEKHTRLIVNGDEVRFPTVEYVLQSTGLQGVRIETELPYGCGFGLSGASALATAFLADLPAIKLADIAHEAEVVNLTGLGDIVTQTFAGVIVRRNASCPSRAIIDRYSWNLELDFLVLGKLETKDIIGNELKRKKIADAGKRWTKEFVKKPTIENLFRCSNSFGKETGLVDFVSDVIETVQSEGGMAAMIMLGKAVFALNGYKALKEFGEPFKAKIDCCGVRKIE
jgi:pantoate kinase